jgi:hypothetical protein
MPAVCQQFLRNGCVGSDTVCLNKETTLQRLEAGVTAALQFAHWCLLRCEHDYVAVKLFCAVQYDSCAFCVSARAIVEEEIRGSLRAAKISDTAFDAFKRGMHGLRNLPLTFASQVENRTRWWKSMTVPPLAPQAPPMPSTPQTPPAEPARRVLDTPPSPHPVRGKRTRDLKDSDIPHFELPEEEDELPALEEDEPPAPKLPRRSSERLNVFAMEKHEEIVAAGGRADDWDVTCRYRKGEKGVIDTIYMYRPGQSHIGTPKKTFRNNMRLVKKYIAELQK